MIIKELRELLSAVPDDLVVKVEVDQYEEDVDQGMIADEVGCVIEGHQRPTNRKIFVLILK